MSPAYRLKVCGDRVQIYLVHNGIWYIWYIGVFGYSDDNMLLSQTQCGLQEMLKNCEKYAEKHNLKFSTASGPCKKKDTRIHE